MEYSVCVIMYKYHYQLDQVLLLTFPQLKILEENLVKILKAENGSEDKPATTNPETNTFVMAESLKVLKARTGRDSFSLDELYDMPGTIKKYTLQK